jgi:hypothetical protein
MREETMMFQGGVAHGDMAEGDFQEAGRQQLSQHRVLQQRVRHVEQDFLLPLWMLLLVLTVLASWWAGVENRRTL